MAKVEDPVWVFDEAYSSDDSRLRAGPPALRCICGIWLVCAIGRGVFFCVCWIGCAQRALGRRCSACINSKGGRIRRQRALTFRQVSRAAEQP